MTKLGKYLISLLLISISYFSYGIDFGDAGTPPAFGDPSIPYATSFTHWVSGNLNPQCLETTRHLPPRLNCVVRFIVDEAGKVSDIEIVQASSWPSYDLAVVETIKASPQWQPATDSEGQPSTTIIVLPFISSVR